MSYAHIVVATDFSEQAERALGVAKKLAERFGSRVTLFHGYSILPPSAVYPDALWPAAHIDLQLREDARRSLEVLRREWLPSIEQVEVVAVPHPNAAIAISDYASEHGADLVVAGTHGRTGLAHVLLGSVAEALVRHAPCPVLVVRGNMERFPQHVLACTDFSAEAESALAAAGHIARAFEAKVTLLHVYGDPPELPGLPERPYRTVEGIDEDMKKALADLERKHFGGTVETALLVAPNHAEGIATYAERHGIDLIALATHGRTGIRRLLLGSVAEKVVRHAPCSVIVARSRG